MLSKADHARIAEAVAKAEAGTTGEVFCILAKEVSQYRETPIAWAAGVALILPPVALLLGVQPWRFAEGVDSWSAAAPGNINTFLAEAIGGYALIQAVLFLVTALIVAIPPVRRVLTPRGLKRHRVRRAAYAHFASTGLAQMEGRTGVLIFACSSDRQVEIVADKAIHDLVGDAVWNEAVAALVKGVGGKDPAAGFVRAVEICGAALSAHFPSQGPHDNKFQDGLLEV